jgi:DNA-binding NarL/FixJ family response regulator
MAEKGYETLVRFLADPKHVKGLSPRDVVAIKEGADRLRSALDGLKNGTGAVVKRSDEAGTERLTKREREVLKSIAEGRTTKQVAGVLGVSFKTAACHRYRIMEKLGIHDTASLVRYAIRHGFVRV